MQVAAWAYQAFLFSLLCWRLTFHSLHLVRSTRAVLLLFALHSFSLHWWNVLVSWLENPHLSWVLEPEPFFFVPNFIFTTYRANFWCVTLTQLFQFHSFADSTIYIFFCLYMMKQTFWCGWWGRKWSKKEQKKIQNVNFTKKNEENSKWNFARMIYVRMAPHSSGISKVKAAFIQAGKAGGNMRVKSYILSRHIQTFPFAFTNLLLCAQRRKIPFNTRRSMATRKTLSRQLFHSTKLISKHTHSHAQKRTRKILFCFTRTTRARYVWRDWKWFLSVFHYTVIDYHS